MSRNALIWLLDNPARFIAGIVLALVCVATTTVLLANRPAREAAAHPANPGGAPATILPARTASPTAPSSSSTHPQEPESFAAAARPILDAFLDRYLAAASQEDLASLSDITTTSLAGGLASTDPSHLPRGPISEVRMTADGPFSATFRVDVPDGALLVYLVTEPGGPKVAAIEPEAT